MDAVCVTSVIICCDPPTSREDFPDHWAEKRWEVGHVSRVKLQGLEWGGDHVMELISYNQA